MNILGIGPTIAIPGILSFCAAAICGHIYDHFEYWFINRIVTVFVGTILITIGIIFLVDSVRKVSRKEDRLLTGGVYRIVRHPMYSSFIVFITPGISLLMNNWLIIAPAIISILVFRRYIHKEEEYLAEKFGDEYNEYKKQVKQIVPYIL